MFDEPGFSDDADLDPAAIMLETFVYCSRAAENVDADEVSRLVAFSQKRNVARGITGVLVFGSGVFFQWIEGPPAEVRTLIANLHGDTRHHDIVTLDQSVEVRERLYPHWDMEPVEPDDLPTLRRALVEHMKGRSDGYQVEYRIKHAEGRWVWIEDRGRAVERDAAGRVLRMLGTRRDISARKLQEEQQRLSATVFEAASEGIVILDPDYRLLAVNQAFCRITGYARHELLGRNAGLFDGPLTDPDEVMATEWVELDHLSAFQVARHHIRDSGMAEKGRVGAWPARC